MYWSLVRTRSRSAGRRAGCPGWVAAARAASRTAASWAELGGLPCSPGISRTLSPYSYLNLALSNTRLYSAVIVRESSLLPLWELGRLGLIVLYRSWASSENLFISYKINSVCTVLTQQHKLHLSTPVLICSRSESVHIVITRRFSLYLS